MAGLVDKSQFLKNAAGNWGSFFVSAVTTFLISPFVVRTLGKDSFGIWTLIVSVTGYYGFLDFGMRSAVGQYTTRYLALKDRKKLNETVNTALTVLSLAGLAIFTLSLGLIYYLPSVFQIGFADTSVFRISICLVGLTIVMKLPFTVFQALIVGVHRYDTLGIIGSILKVANTVAVFVTLREGGGLIGLALVTAGFQVIEDASYLIVAKKLVPGLDLKLFAFNQEAFREIRNYGIFSFIINISRQLIFYADTFVVGHYMGPTAVTYYAIGANLVPYLESLTGALTSPLMQIATALDAQGKIANLRSLYLQGTRYILGFATLMGVNVLIVGRLLLKTWMGPEFVEGGPYGSSYTIMIILTCANLMYLSQNVGRQIIFGSRKNRPLAGIMLVEAVSNLALSIVLVKTIGIAGVALGTLIPLVITHGLVLPVFVSRLVETNPLEFFKKALLPSLSAAIPTLLAGWWFMRTMPIGGWFGVIAGGCVTTLLFAAIAYLFIIERRDKQMLVDKVRSLARSR
jgi:O-antigen/teichoic acid export membrane protein